MHADGFCGGALRVFLHLCAETIEFNDRPDHWESSIIPHAARYNIQEMRHALAHVQLSLLCMAQLMGEMAGKPYNIVEWALTLSSGEDVSRGVRVRREIEDTCQESS